MVTAYALLTDITFSSINCHFKNVKAAKTTTLMVSALLMCYLPLVIKWQLCWIESPTFSILAQVREQNTCHHISYTFLDARSCKQLHESLHLCCSCSGLQKLSACLLWKKIFQRLSNVSEIYWISKNKSNILDAVIFTIHLTSMIIVD